MEDAAQGLINELLSTTYSDLIYISPVQHYDNGNDGLNGKFTIDVTYNFPEAIPNVTQTKDIGYKSDGTTTNTVEIVVEVFNGKVNIVTMYPI